MQRWDPTFEQKLLAAGDYRSFAREFFAKADSPRSHANPKPLSFGRFTQRAGFSSKSFLNDVLAGRKRLTPASFDRTARGLGLSSPWKAYFRALVAEREPEFREPGQSEAHYAKQRARLHAKLAKRLRGTELAPQSPLTKVFLEPSLPDVYAALGSFEEGASLDEITGRTGLAPARAKALLARMGDVGLLRRGEAGRYLPLAAALESAGLGEEAFFVADTKRAIARARARLVTQASSPEALFMTQTFSVAKRDLAKFRNQLADLVRNFAADAEDQAGDTVAEVFVGFTHSHGPDLH